LPSPFKITYRGVGDMYIDTGGNKPVLVLVHGIGSRKESWKSQLSLAEHRRLIIPDLRGHGENQVTEDITMRNLGLDIINLLESLDIKEADFLGLSLGGAVVKEIASIKPNIVRSMILANTASVFPTFITKSTVEELQNALEWLTDDDFIKGICMRGLYDKTLLEEAREGFKLRRDTYIETAKATVGVNYLPTIMFFRKPILIITSSHDTVTPSQNAMLTYMFNPFAKFKYISNCGHLSNIDKPEEFNRTVLNFLT
jgi:3-oxoadipate enol-lactonase